MKTYLSSINELTTVSVHRKFIILTILIAFFIAIKPDISEASEGSVDGPNSKLNFNYLKSYGTSYKDIAISPIHWDGNSWLKAGGFVAVTAGLMFADKGIKRLVARNRSTLNQDIAHFGRSFGEVKLVIPSALAGYVIGNVIKNKRIKRVSLTVLKSIIVTGTSLQVISRIGHRTRPDETDDSQKWDGPSISSKNLSFPSGHSAVSFSIASVLSSEFSEYRYFRPFFFTMCGLTAISRVYDNRHWASDVFMGSTLGYYMGSIIADGNTNKEMTDVSNNKEGLRGIVPIFNNGKIEGLSLAYSF